MKRIVLSFMLLIGISISASALSYDEARRRAWFLTDKMAYELNLTQEQYDEVYEINFDYFLRMDNRADISGVYWNYRLTDLEYVLYDWQFSLFRGISYFYRPLTWYNDSWYFPVYSHYRTGYYYFERPRIYVTYRGYGGPQHVYDANRYSGWRMTRGNVDHNNGMRDRFYGNNGHANVGVRQGGNAGVNMNNGNRAGAPGMGMQGNRANERMREGNAGMVSRGSNTNVEQNRMNQNGNTRDRAGQNAASQNRLGNNARTGSQTSAPQQGFRNNGAVNGGTSNTRVGRESSTRVTVNQGRANAASRMQSSGAGASAQSRIGSSAPSNSRSIIGGSSTQTRSSASSPSSSRSSSANGRVARGGNR